MPPESLAEKSKCRIYAAGCNAWYNLSFFPQTVKEGSQPRQHGDIHSFTVVGESNTVEDLKAYLTWTTAHIDGQKRVAGAAPGEDVQTQLLRSTQNGKGEVLNALDGSSDTRNPESDIISYEAPVASEQSAIPESFPRPKLVAVDINLKAAAAWQTGFVMMDEDGNVYTLGDRRYAACLGRPVTADQPAEGPHMVEDLPDHTDKIRKVVAGGYTVGALTEEGHLYAWGMQTPGHASSEKQAITGLSAMPNYQSIPKEGEDEDVADVSFGDCHALALTREGNVYVIGGNKNGQLGLGWDRKHRAESWEKVDLDLGEYRVKEVVAGPQTSFLIARLP